MTPQEANILRYMERRGQPVTRHELASQFGISMGYLDTIMHSLKRHLLIEQDKLYYRATSQAQDALRDFDDHFKYVPFEGKQQW